MGQQPADQPPSPDSEELSEQCSIGGGGQIFFAQKTLKRIRQRRGLGID
jgi:hypothetical protein